MRKVLIETGDIAFTKYAADWDLLARSSASGTIFQTRQWQQNWLKHYGRGVRIITISIWDDGLVGLYNLIQTTSLWQAIRPLGTGPSDYLPPLIRNGETGVAQEIIEALLKFAKGKLVDLHQIPNDGNFLTLSQQKDSIDQAKCLVLKLPPTMDEYISGLSKSLRYDVRRLNGKALTEKNVRIEWVSPESVDRFSNAFFELHKARWKSRGLPGAFFGRGEAFQKDWMQVAANEGWLWMSLLFAEDKPVGTVYAMQFGKTCYFYQAGMDPTASSLSPGTILVSQTIARAIEEGNQEFDFMRGDEPYKRRWKPQHERTNLRILLPGNSVVGRVGMRWNEFAWRVESKIRDRVEGKSLKPKTTSGPKE